MGKFIFSKHKESGEVLVNFSEVLSEKLNVFGRSINKIV
jgi:hypothetical protein